MRSLAAGESGFEQFGSDEQPCEIAISNATMHVFAVSGEVPVVGFWTKPLVVQDISRYTRDEKAVVVTGEELKARIEGFGSG